ncbi:MAG: RNA-binding S4 domain-containing protein [Corynebacterium sp.]|nr:RNA-binding S4 domain-containing protein [Corynebacterium sp.]
MTRIDQYVWAIRLTKTRTAAADAVKAGHVKLNGVAVKPAQPVVPGDTIRIWVNHRERIVEVVELLDKRVSASRAQAAYIDHSPPPPPKEVLASLPVRDRGSGRPTKKDRRELDRLRGRSSR